MTFHRPLNELTTLKIKQFGQNRFKNFKSVHMDGFNEQDTQLINLALDLRGERKYSDALTILSKLLKANSDSSIINGLVATIHFEMHDYSGSAQYFKKACLLNPESELV
ncbi:MAG: hypothetical protein AAF223_06010, partial [Bacteroidota bacterium]